MKTSNSHEDICEVQRNAGNASRLMKTLAGSPVDRVPIWMREGFPVPYTPDPSNFSNGWMAEELYRELYDTVAPHMERPAHWRIHGLNRLLLSPQSCIHSTTNTSNELHRTHVRLTTPSRVLTGEHERRRGIDTTWWTHHPIESQEDLHALADVPFALAPQMAEQSYQDYLRACQQAGETGTPWASISSPIVCISGAMEFGLFLELSLEERKFFHTVLEAITRRTLCVLEDLFRRGPIRSVFTLGGSEQCTPPMMSPESYDEFVVPYDGQIVSFLKSHDCYVNIHCHGKVAHALKGIVQMGAHATDPVEPPPDGDTSFAEAREIVGSRLTLMGNLEFDDLEHKTPREIRNHVRDQMRCGRDRVVFTTSAGPISAVNRTLVDNYKAWLDAVLEYGA